MVIYERLSHCHDPHVLYVKKKKKTATKPPRGLNHLFMHISQLNMSREETHYEILLPLWV